MEGSRFDTLTRRGVGLLAGGIAGSLAGLAEYIGADAKKKKKKKPCCRPDLASCSTSSECCSKPDSVCDDNGCFPGVKSCCRPAGKSCRFGCDCCGAIGCLGGICS